MINTWLYDNEIEEMEPNGEIEEFTRCMAREIMRSWLRNGARLAHSADCESIKKRLDKIFSIDFPEHEVSTLCEDVGLFTDAAG